MSENQDGAKLRAKFDLLDENGDGQITLVEFAEFCADLDLDPEVVSSRFQRIDTNGDGLLSYEEFRAALKG